MTITTWDSGNKSNICLLSNSDLTATIAVNCWTYAVDLLGKWWVYNHKTGKWNNDTISNQDPGSNVGGWAPSPAMTAGTFYPALWLSGSTDNRVFANFGASTITQLPSGFSSWNSLTSATNTWDTSFNSSGKILYTDGDLTAYQADNSGYANAIMSRSTSGASSGKGCWEFYPLSAVGMNPGAIRSDVANTNYPHEVNNKGVSISDKYYYNNADTGVSALNTLDTAAGSCRGSLLRTSGKLMFEATFNFVGSRDITLGVCNPSYTTFANTSGGSNTWGYNRNTTIARTAFNGAAPVSCDGISNGTKLGIYIDFSNQRLWYYVPATARYNDSGTANPATNTGGIDISAIMGSGLYPWCGGGDSSGWTIGPASIVANFGATAFTSPTPTGFRSWNDGPLAGGHSRGIIIP